MSNAWVRVDSLVRRLLRRPCMQTALSALRTGSNHVGAITLERAHTLSSEFESLYLHDDFGSSNPLPAIDRRDDLAGRTRLSKIRRISIELDELLVGHPECSLLECNLRAKRSASAPPAERPKARELALYLGQS